MVTSLLCCNKMHMFQSIATNIFSKVLFSFLFFFCFDRFPIFAIVPFVHQWSYANKENALKTIFICGKSKKASKNQTNIKCSYATTLKIVNSFTVTHNRRC